MSEREFQESINEYISKENSVDYARIRTMPKRAMRRINAERHLSTRHLAKHNAKSMKRYDSFYGCGKFEECIW